jgi:DNA-binding MarR family transcriptional regulator
MVSRTRSSTLDGVKESDALVDALAQVSFATTSALTRLAAEHDLSLTQLRVLGILRDRSVGMSDLATYLGLERSSLSGLIDRAEQRGLVVRARSDQDRRAFDLSLTEEGSRLAESATARSRELLAPLVRRLDRAQKRELRTLLELVG